MNRPSTLLIIALAIVLALLVLLLFLGTAGEPGTGVHDNIVNVAVNWRQDYIVVWW